MSSPRYRVGDWAAADITPYIDRALEVFGPEWLMSCSDWPVANVRGGYSKVWRETNLALAHLSADERDWIPGGTAATFYRWPVTGRRRDDASTNPSS
jgi:L-fuconolactonase